MIDVKHPPWTLTHSECFVNINFPVGRGRELRAHDRLGKCRSQVGVLEQRGTQGPGFIE